VRNESAGGSWVEFERLLESSLPGNNGNIGQLVLTVVGHSRERMLKKVNFLCAKYLFYSVISFIYIYIYIIDDSCVQQILEIFLVLHSYTMSKHFLLSNALNHAPGIFYH